MVTRNFQDVIFQHLIEVAGCECVVGTGRERETGKLRLFLFFRPMDRIYYRNGLKGTWDPLTNEDDYKTIKQRFCNAIENRRIPCFMTDTMKSDD